MGQSMRNIHNRRATLLDPNCPVCGEKIDMTLVKVGPFRCPHCGKLLRAVMNGTGPGRWVIGGFIAFLFLEAGWLQGVFGWISYVLAGAVVYPLVLLLLNLILTSLFGVTLEPVERVALGESEG